MPILILANKQDAKGALKEEQISAQYSLHEIGTTQLETAGMFGFGGVGSERGFGLAD